MMDSYTYIHDSAELRELILEYPDLPICIMVGQEAAVEDYAYTYASDIRCHIGEILDCKPPFSTTYIYNDRVDFREDLQDWLSDLEECSSMSDAEFDELLNKELTKYDSYWKRAIIVVADN